MIENFIYILTRVHLIDREFNDDEETLIIEKSEMVSADLNALIELGKMYLTNTFNPKDIIGDLEVDSVSFVVLDENYRHVAEEFHLDFGDRTGYMIRKVELI